MTPAQLDTLTDEAPKDFRAQLGELRPHLIDACAAALEETQDEGKAKVAVSFKLTIDLSFHPPQWTVASSVGIKRSIKGEAHELPDPNQPKLL